MYTWLSNWQTNYLLNKPELKEKVCKIIKLNSSELDKFLTKNYELLDDDVAHIEMLIDEHRRTLGNLDSEAAS